MKTSVKVINETALNITISPDNPEVSAYTFGISKNEAIELCKQLNIAFGHMEFLKHSVKND